MNLKKFFLFYILLIAPLTTTFTLWVSEKYKLSANWFLAIFFGLSAIVLLPVIFRFEYNFYYRWLPSLAKQTGLKEVFKPHQEKFLLLEGTYEGIFWQIYSKSRRTSAEGMGILSGTRIYICAKLPSSAEVDNLIAELKRLLKVQSANLKGDWIEVELYQGEIEGVKDFLRVMDFVINLTIIKKGGKECW
jgi:hypothetical protein